MIGAIKPERRNFTPSPREALYGKRSIHSWIFEPQLHYEKAFEHGKLDALLGYTINQQESEFNTLHAGGFSNDAALRNQQAATFLTPVSIGYSLYKYNAVFSRINYIWNKKYILNLTARMDGSSRFGDKNKFHGFGSAGGAWVMSEESFFPKGLDWVSFAKLRGSFGTTGSDQVGDYSYLSLYGNTSVAVPYQNTVGLMPSGLSNPYLQWEETRKFQAGIDLGFFNDKIIVNAAFAHNRSSNQLLTTPLPWITGTAGIADNLPATVQNTSWEFLLNINNIRTKTISWTTTINFTIPNNKLVAFPNLETSSYAGRLMIGQPVSMIRALMFADVDPATGRYRVIDAKGQLTSTPKYPEDYYVVESRLPRFYGGFQNTLSYRGFELDFIFQFVKQTGSPIIFNNGSFISPGAFLSGSSNQPATVLGRWQKQDDIASIQRFTSSQFALFSSLNRARASDVNLRDASFIRLKNLSLTWQVPHSLQQKLRLKNFRIYIQCQNLLTITNYQGLDPENQSIDGLPPLRLITTGVRIGF